jgi:DNA repair protein RadC
MRGERKSMVLLRNSKTKVTNSEDVAKVFQDLLRIEDKIDQDKEHLYVMHLDGRYQIKLVELVVVGTMTEAMIHPRETYRRAVIEGSACIVIAHNHPSGEVSPSDHDITVTKRLHEAGEILGIPLLDHIVFTTTKFFSFKMNK